MQMRGFFPFGSAQGQNDNVKTSEARSKAAPNFESGSTDLKKRR